MILKNIKEKILKVMIIFLISISLSAGPAASYELEKLVKHLSGYQAEEMKELEDDQISSGDKKIRKRRKEGIEPKV
jgi:hypothetical protein